MFRGAVVLCIIATCLLPVEGKAEPSSAKKRDYGIPVQQMEIGSFLIYQKSIWGVAEIGTYTPIKITRFLSDSLDWKFETEISFLTGRYDNWRSFAAGTGFRYWIDSSTNVTPMMRFGVGRVRSGGGAVMAYGTDVLFQRMFTLDPTEGHRAHRFAVAELHGGLMFHRARGFGALPWQAFASATIAYDWPIWIETWSAHQRKRAKFGVGVEGRGDPYRAVDWLFLTSVSFRSESGHDGRLRHKVDLSAGIGGQGQHRVSVGYTQGF